MSQSATSLSSLIWSVADLLRGDYRPAEYGEVILPLTVLRRLDCVLAKTKQAVLTENAAKEALGINPEPFLLRLSGLRFVNTSPLDMRKLLGDQDNIATNLASYIQGFSPAVRDIFDRFRFSERMDRLRKSGLLYQVSEKFAGINLSPDAYTNHEMGLAFEELIRKFAETSGGTAGEHFTPRDAIHLMVNLLFIEDSEILTPGTPVVRTIYDPTAGTGGMLSVAGEHLIEHNPAAQLTMFGQELNDESYAICKADMLIKGQDIRNILQGNTLTNDGHAGRKFDYMLSNPPYGVDWKKFEKEIRLEHEQLGHAGRFGPGLPRIDDGVTLFLLHLISKMRPAQEGGSRIAIVMSASPLFSGSAGSGESEIRRHLVENDLLEAVVALPTNMFYNTSLATYVWVLCNRKSEPRRGKVQLIDGSRLWLKMPKTLGEKRRFMSEKQIAMVTEIFGAFTPAHLATITDENGTVSQHIVREGEAFQSPTDNGPANLAPFSLVFDNERFGYRTITVEQPLRGEDGTVVLVERGKHKGKPQPDVKLRDTEDVALGDDLSAYFMREILPHAPDAWIDPAKTKTGYEIAFNSYFYVFEPPRALESIDKDLTKTLTRIKELFKEMAT